MIKAQANISHHAKFINYSLLPMLYIWYSQYGNKHQPGGSIKKLSDNEQTLFSILCYGYRM
jgi:hypothetical protein